MVSTATLPLSQHCYTVPLHPPPSYTHHHPHPHTTTPSWSTELLAEAADSLLYVLWRLRRPAPPDHAHWERPRVLPHSLPFNSMSSSVDSLMCQSELFTRQPGSGFRGFFSHEVRGRGRGRGRGLVEWRGLGVVGLWQVR